MLKPGELNGDGVKDPSFKSWREAAAGELPSPGDCAAFISGERAPANIEKGEAIDLADFIGDSSKSSGCDTDRVREGPGGRYNVLSSPAGAT